jgi:hypothetical protein
MFLFQISRKGVDNHKADIDQVASKWISFGSFGLPNSIDHNWKDKNHGAYVEQPTRNLIKTKDGWMGVVKIMITNMGGAEPKERHEMKEKAATFAKDALKGAFSKGYKVQLIEPTMIFDSGKLEVIINCSIQKADEKPASAKGKTTSSLAPTEFLTRA